MRVTITFCLILLTLLTNIVKANASVNRPLSSYFVDNIVFQTLYNGGYYTLIIILVIVSLCYFSRAIREVILSLIMAISAVFFIIFFYEALEDFQFIPPAT